MRVIRKGMDKKGGLAKILFFNNDFRRYYEKLTGTMSFSLLFADLIEEG